MSEPTHVLDASALLALLLDEPGADEVARILDRACISAANLSEVAAKLADRGVAAGELRDSLDELDLEVRPLTRDQALRAGDLRTATRAAGLSLGDRCCLALAGSLQPEAVTADAAWMRIDIAVRVRLIR